MTMVNHRLNKLSAVRLGLILLWLLAWTGAALAADSGALPAKDWNPRQVERLQAPAGRGLSFAVLGDNRSNPEVFGRVLRQKVTLQAGEVHVEVQRIKTEGEH